MTKPNETLKKYWRSLQDRADTKTKLRVMGQSGASAGEFPPGADELVVSGSAASRRKFMGILGASTALAGLQGCGYVRKPKENIMPFAKRPEDMIPGEPMFYASAVQVGGTALGILVESQDGRPTKIEGNPEHAASRGKTDVWAQASVLNLYDPDRSRAPRSRTEIFHLDGASEAEVKEGLEHAVCQGVYDRVLEATKSLDRATKAQSDCKTRVEEAGKWTIDAHEGSVTGTLAVPAEVQVDSQWVSLWSELDARMRAAQKNKGKGVGYVVDFTMSPTYARLLNELRKRQSEAKFYLCDATAPQNGVAAQELLGSPGTRVSVDLRDAKTILALDSDFLGTDPDHVRLTGEYAQNRRMETPEADMSRLYAVEPSLSITGAQADHRLRLRGSQVSDFAQLLVLVLVNEKNLVPPQEAIALARNIAVPTLAPEVEKFARVVADDLIANKGRCAVLVGERQPAAVHGLGMLINELLGNFNEGPNGAVLRTRMTKVAVPTRPLTELAADLDAGDLDTVVCLGTNPAYEAPGSLGLDTKLAKAKTLVHFGTHLDETGQMAHWHGPVSHYLEAWGDLESTDGTTAIQQPLIAPLFDTPSLIEVTNRLLNPGTERGGLELVRDYWNNENGATVPDRRWQKWLHDGVVTAVRRDVRMVPRQYQRLATALTELPTPIDGGFEVNFHLGFAVFGGRFSNNGWMQELPDPASKLVWDNAAFISPYTAEQLGAKDGDLISIKAGDRSAQVPCWIVPGQADNTVSVHLGYGRRGLGEVANDAGFDAYKLQDAQSPSFAAGDVSKGAGSAFLVSTQDYGSLDPDGPDGNPILGTNYEPRSLYRETTVEGYRQDPQFAKRGDLMPDTRLESLWEHPELKAPMQWGMSIDLNACTGCQTCTIACQAENNIPVVGKDQVANGREMHWIRLDRYYTGDANAPEVVYQPVGCQHCESAPCETVCPVAATVHSPEGLNDMAYNRCIGTRYCSNNCPYKVRRFNYFNFNYDMDPLHQMQRNTDVTVRFRGVIEKCSYCVQRINQAKIDAHADMRDIVPDGTIVTACEQACPANAITFGDIADPESRVSKQKALTRAYTLLADLNTLPRTSYLGRVRNPNPALEDA